MPTIGGLRNSQFDEGISKTVIISVLCAVLALGYHFRESIFSSFVNTCGGTGRMFAPATTVAHASLQPLSPGQRETEFKAEERFPSPSSPTAVAPADSLPPFAREEPVRVGLYIALRDTPVLRVPASTAEMVAFVYQEQRFLVVGGYGEYLAIRSIRRDRRNPPGFVLKEDAVFFAG